MSRIRDRSPMADHAIRAGDRFFVVNGSLLSAGMTYYGFLALFPLLAVALGVSALTARFVPSIDATFRQQLADVLPAGIDMNAVASASLTVGLIGLGILLYAGVRWVGSLRRGLFLIWGEEPRALPFLKGLVRDILTLLLLGACLLASLAVTVVVSMSTDALSRHFEVGGWWLDVGVRLLGLTVSLATDLAAFFLIYRGLPPRTTSTRSLLRGSMMAAVGFEALKQAATLIVSGVSTNVIYGTFAATVGLLVWIGYASRLLLMAGAWVVTSEPPPAPAPAPPAPPGAAPGVRGLG